MALPWMNKDRSTAAGIVMKVRTPDKDAPEPSSEDSAVLAAAEDILRAIDSKDAQHLAQALRAAFQILDSEPHEEGPHEDTGEQG